MGTALRRCRGCDRLTVTPLRVETFPKAFPKKNMLIVNETESCSDCGRTYFRVWRETRDGGELTVGPVFQEGWLP